MAAVYVADGIIIPEKQYADGKVKVEIAEDACGVSADRADGLMLTSEDYTADGVVVTGDKTFTFGGKNTYYEVDGKPLTLAAGTYENLTVEPA